MRAKRQGRARLVRWLGAGGVIGAGLLFGLSDPAAAATTASFSRGTLTVFGDGADNTVTVSATPPARSWSTAAPSPSTAARRPSPTPP